MVPSYPDRIGRFAPVRPRTRFPAATLAEAACAWRMRRRERAQLRLLLDLDDALLRDIGMTRAEVCERLRLLRLSARPQRWARLPTRPRWTPPWHADPRAWTDTVAFAAIVGAGAAALLCSL